MPKPDSKSPAKISLEDLLRLKRHERPAPEFWARFDRELQQRVWRTLLEPAPATGTWVRQFFLRRLGALGAGAAAVMILGLAWQNRTISHLGSPVASIPVVGNAMTSAEVLTPSSANAVAATATFESARPADAVVALVDASPTTNLRKIPAMVAFAAESADAAFSTRVRGSVY